MYLKRIELIGFKSFADKTELEFGQGISAVVGPNGSGKSNISDGIRWVLGEQSAKSLRGGNMQDVIFAGSDARKAVNFGEVSLTLDNSDNALPLDFSEVTVTRRVHRSGESEYFINRQSCRLKDIVELFMDTGIGKEAYSIIGQGRIEEILSARSEDRRALLEEASGIVKYKARKKESVKKLEETEQNLLRINDLVSELEDQVEPLREQSEKAQQFKLLKEELKTKEVSLYVYQIDQLHAAWKEAGERLEALQRQELELSTVVSAHDAQLEQQRVDIRRMEEQIEQKQGELLHITEEAEKCEGQGEVLRERARFLERNHEQLLLEITEAERRLGLKREELTALETKHQEVKAVRDELEQLLREEERRLLGVSGGLTGEEEERLKGQLLDKLNELAQARNELRYVEQQKETAIRRLQRLDDDGGKWVEQNDRLQEKLRELEERLAEASRDVQESRNEYIRLSQSLQEDEPLLFDVQQTLRKWEQKYDSLISRRDTMKEMQNDYDGFQHGVRELLKARARGGLSGIHGAVAELLRVPAAYETAVETALGAALQHIVVDNEAAGRAAIAYLKQRQLGRATVLPLDVIRGRSIGDSDRRSIEGADGYVGVAADLVATDRAYESILQNMLGNVIIAGTLEQANKIAARCQYRYRVVTLEGDIVNAGGSMTGGSLQKRTSSILGRQRQLEELDEDIAKTDKQLGELRSNAQTLKAKIADTGKQLEKLRSEGEAKRMTEQQLRSERDRTESELTSVREQLELLTQDQDGHREEMQSSDRRIEELKQRTVELEAEEQQLQAAIRDAEQARKAGESLKEELQAQLTEFKVKVAAASQEQQSLLEQIRRQQAEFGAAEADIAADRERLQAMESEQQQGSVELAAQIERLNELRILRQKCSEQLDFQRATRAELVRKLEEAESETKEQRIKLKQVEDQLRQTEVRAGRLDVELDNLLKKLSEEYELSYELAKERYPVPEDVPSAQAEVRDIRRQISSLGDVNLGAIEEFLRVSERYDFLNTQKNDLIEAKTALYQVIRDMDAEMSKRFVSTFQEIRSHFVVVFSKLFGGGRADLMLTEPDNPLETGIEIVAQPPGKKLQNLQLLSGGEKALTALALLFSILHVKPVPFCVLDEVEAALDEANVTRYAQYLREFSQQTQFIVVTHRKGTMEEADVLYGVTMEEGGVSKLVSVRLEDENEEQASA
ncbi:chromosome segregation protein SMC [Paenibacillus turpanensis]|uniref:chromosome segregation protein SMC n=1 Tax=Paenibacillus turpanensis TaxID=2689078 RepID=UPI00140D1059|nr:chromosome segregation protein SMC [Paenibacillus turpanensis]